MANTTLPQNQIASLPVVTATQALAPDVITIVGDKVLKLWLPATLGIQGATFVGDPLDPPNGAMILSPFLDVRGCNEFLAIMTCLISVDGARESGVGYSVFPQYRAGGPGGLLPKTGVPGTTEFFQVSNSSGLPPDQSGVPTPQTNLFTFGWSNQNLQAVTMSYDMRLWFRRTVGQKVGQFFSVWLWAQGS